MTAGTIADSRAVTTQWRAETVPGTVTFTVTTADSRGGTASGTVAVEVIGAPLQALSDIQFDLDQAELRPDALSILAVALKALNDVPTRRLHIEGYASDDGTTEYNRMLGERRAMAVRDYLVGRGIDGTRITTFSFGEERPKVRHRTGSHASPQPTRGARHPLERSITRGLLPPRVTRRLKPALYIPADTTLRLTRRDNVERMLQRARDTRTDRGGSAPRHPPYAPVTEFTWGCDSGASPLSGTALRDRD